LVENGVRLLIPAGDIAVVRLDRRLDISPINVVSIEPGMDAFRREPDGHWRIMRYIAYDVPAP
jgi:hypothetical protein